MPNSPFRSPERQRQRRSTVDEVLSDEEDETLLRSARSARYGDASGSPAAAPPQRYPALAVDAGAAALVQRLQLVLQEEDEVLPETVDTFAHETVLTGLKLHLRTNGIAKESEYACGGTLAPIVIQRPAFDQTFFHVTLPTGADQRVDKLDFFSVPNKALSNLMVRRGYPLIGVTHLPADESKLPAAVTEREATRDRARAAEDELAAPTELKVPNKVMPIDQGGSAPTVASQIVEQFELRVVTTKASGRPEVFSPMRLWTKQARKAAKFLPKQSTPFSVRCMLYYFIRTELKDEEPSAIATSYDKLRTDAEIIKSRKADSKGQQKKRRRGGEAEAAAPAAAGVAAEDLLCGEWFDLALGVSKEFVQ